jgi:hypothetical protein
MRTFAYVVALIAIAKLNGLMNTSRGTRRHGGTETS